MLRRFHLASVSAFAVVLAFGCASTPAGTSGTITPRRDPNYIAPAELQTPDIQALNLYDAISRLRPNFFKNRGPSSITSEGQYQIKVRLDGTLMGGIETLRDIPASQVEDARYYTPSEAVPKFGTEYPGGAIEVRRRHG